MDVKITPQNAKPRVEVLALLLALSARAWALDRVLRGASHPQTKQTKAKSLHHDINHTL